MGDLIIDDRIILRSILKKWDMRFWTGLIWLKTGFSCGISEHFNEPSDFIMDDNILEQISHCQFVR
jgi:hypothetical protein